MSDLIIQKASEVIPFQVRITKKEGMYEPGDTRPTNNMETAELSELLTPAIVLPNRVESPFTETPSHTTVQAMSHTAVLLLCLPKANERLKSPNLLNHSRFIALCTI